MNPDYVPLPGWLDGALWADWCSFRRAVRNAPWTVKAAVLSVSRLTTLRDQGHEPRAVIEQSILNGWRGLFGIRVEQQRNGTGPETAATTYAEDSPAARIVRMEKKRMETERG